MTLRYRVSRFTLPIRSKIIYNIFKIIAHPGHKIITLEEGHEHTVNGNAPIRAWRYPNVSGKYQIITDGKRLRVLRPDDDEAMTATDAAGLAIIAVSAALWVEKHSKDKP